MVRHNGISNLTIVLVLIIALLLPSTFSDSNSDRSALLSLRSVLRGRTLRWNTTSETPCEWEGVGCNVRTGRVISLRLPGDGLRGELASTHIGNLTELRALSLRGNAISGPIPDGIASCENLRDLHLQGNRFSGEIPRWLFGLKNLRRVNLGSNELSGALSSEFNNLTELRVLYLESNRFAGGLPDLNGLTGLRRFNVSFNELVAGSIPPSLARFSSESFRGTSLCGGNLSSCTSNENSRSRDRKLSGGAKAGIIASGSVVVLISILVVLLMISRRKRSRNHRTSPHRIERSMLQYPITVTPVGDRFSKPDLRPVTATEKDENTPPPPQRSDSRRIHARESLENDGLVFLRGNSSNAFTLQELLMSSAQVMCKGATGTTYKAHLDHGVEVIVKRLKNVTLPENAFRHKIEALGSFDHENLLPLMGYFNGRDEKLLVYKSLPRGISLFELLHENGKQKLSWEIRARIALGVARAIEYLHSTEREITHGNINSNNVLLSDYYEPHLCESGLMGLVSSSTPNLLSGYKAPEVSDMRSVSQQSDVHSFGVLLLELVTGKEPERLLADEGIELSRWVRSFDGEGKRASEEAIDRELMSVAISCTDLRPHCFRVSCVHHLPSEEESQTKKKNSSETIKLIKSDGDVKFYDRPIKALELMQQFPRHMVCRSDSFYIGKKTPFLSQNDKLKPGNYYFLLPAVFFQSALSFATLIRSRTVFSGNKSPFEVVKTRSGGLRVKVCEEMIVKHHREFVSEEDHDCRGVLLNTPQLRKEYETLVVRRRRWKPKLDTIKEKKKEEKSAVGNKRLKIKRLLV